MTDQAPVRFDTKIAVVVREDLAVWQKLNVTAFLAGGVATSAPEAIGEAYVDADGEKYLATFRQPAMVFAADAAGMRRTLDRARARGVTVGVFTDDLFATGHDGANREAVVAVTTADLVLAGVAFRCDRRDADKITKGLSLHP